MDFPKITKAQSPSGDKGMFLKVADGQEVVGVFRGGIYAFYQLWPFGGEKIESDQPFAGAKQRFKANFVVKEPTGFAAKIWEFGEGVASDLETYNQTYPLETIKIKIVRKGSGKETRWTVLPLLNPKDALGPKLLEELSAVKLHVLGNAPLVAPPPSDTPSWQDEELPF